MFQNQNTGGGALGAGAANTMDPTQQQTMNYNGLQHQQQAQQQGTPHHQQQQEAKNVKNVRQKPYVKITEQPAGKALRFRYECEGRSAGSIPGVNSTPENRTYPTIEIVGYKGRAVVVVSCVTKDKPYRPHPHNLVGKEGCKKGVCTLEINSETMRAVFSNLGIQCVKKKDIEAALKAREDIRVDPFKTGFSHRYQPSSIDLNSVRLCFQVFMESEQKGRFTEPLPPVVSDPIFDKKAMSDLVICRLCTCSATVLGNTQIILLCEKVAKEDIAVRFFEEKNGQVVWEAFGEFQHTDVHKQTAIAFKTPRYHTLDITEPAKVFIQLKRPSDGVTSEKLPFEYKPLDSGRHTFWSLRRNLKRKPDEDLFQQILAVDQCATECAAETAAVEIIDLDTPTQTEAPIVQPASDITSQVVVSAPAQKCSEQEIDLIINEKVRELEEQALAQQQEQIETNAPMEQECTTLAASEPAQLSANDKIKEWMKSNEIQPMETNVSSDEQTNEALSMPMSPNTADEDKTLNELLEQVAELDEIYSDHVLRRDNYNNSILNELKDMDACLPDAAPLADGTQTAMEMEEPFDDAATYTSLQIAFKNPLALPIEDVMPPTPPGSHCAPEEHYDHVEVNSQHNTVHNNAESGEQLNEPPPRPAPPKFNSPHMHVTAAEEEKLPPLPPKRLRKQDSNAENRSIEANTCDTLERRPRNTAPIIIMKTPDQSPPTKRLPPKPNGSNSNTLPKQKKPGFFAKLFSRRKSKSDLSQAPSEQGSVAGSKTNSKTVTPNASREPSIGNFQINESTRASIRSAKSLQPAAFNSNTDKSAAKTTKQGKPVGRSVSSVSGKRPAHLNADVIHIPLKGDSASSLPHNEMYSQASTITLGNALDRRTASALQLAEIPICDGNMELVAITDRQSLRNLCEGEFNVLLDPNVDLTEAEHFALYTSIPPQATVSEFDETSAYYAPVDAGEILTPEEVAKRLAAANRLI